jgi:hypothetical protein
MVESMLRLSLSHPKARLNLAGKSFISLAALPMFHLLGCATAPSPSPAPPSAPLVAPAISTQPANQSIPLGLSATYSVSAKGSASLAYQWSKNGAPITGATSSSFTTPATVSTDMGSLFTVAISNPAGSVTSNPASLTITARAPKPGDLRFQQVDAASTVNGYNNGPLGIGSGITGTLGFYFGQSIGTPLYLSTGDCIAVSPPPGAGCSWLFMQFYLPSQLTGLGLSTGYSGGYFTNFPADLQNTNLTAGTGNPPSAPNSVITSLDLEPGANLFAASWIQTTQGGGFDMSMQTVSPAALQAAATQEGAHSRVITAISYNASQVTYLSYGWQSDTSTVYETQVATATLATIPAVAANLASNGYIITATGGSGIHDSFFLVGTRVQGDTVPRPFLSATQLGTTYVGTLMQQGYAIVAAVQGSDGLLTWLTER